MSVEVGRLPSILGSEFFRTHVTSYSVSSFEDAVIFVHDVERCVAKLDRLSEIFLAAGILEPLEGPRADDEESCQEVEVDENLVTI